MLRAALGMVDLVTGPLAPCPAQGQVFGREFQPSRSSRARDDGARPHDDRDHLVVRRAVAADVHGAPRWTAAMTLFLLRPLSAFGDWRRIPARSPRRATWSAWMSCS